MTNRLKRLITGTRALESRLTSAFEQAAETVAGVGGRRPPLELVELAVDEIATHVQPAGRGRHSFPFNRVTVTFVAPTPEDQARFEAICEGPPSIHERVMRRLTSAGCDRPDFDVQVEFVATLPDRGIAFENRGASGPGGGPAAHGDSEPQSGPADPGASGPQGGSVAPGIPDATPRSAGRQFDIALARVGPAARAPRGRVVQIDLLVTNGTCDRGTYSFTTLPIAIGRGADVRDSRNQLLRINHVAFTEGEAEVNRTVSRRHARIELDEAAGRPRLIDDNSAQGTSVIRGGRGIAVPRGSRGLGLQTDDEIVLGQARIRVTIGGARPQ
jgi:hypothetical protein